jgi:hypothetical protein
MKNYKQFKAKLLKDKEIKKTYEKLGPEFNLIAMLIKKRIEKGFDETDKRLDKIDIRLDRIENFLLKQHSIKIETLEKRIDRLEEALAIK